MNSPVGWQVHRTGERLDARGRQAAALRAAALLSAGCRGSASVPASLPSMREEHCWWAVVRSASPPDSLVARYATAFEAIGLAPARVTRSADTSWAEAGPARLACGAGGLWASRVVAYRRGDSTRFRHYVAWTGAGEPDSVVASRLLGVCGAITRAAAVRASTPRAPTGEETLPLWTRRPPPARSRR